MCLRGLSVKCKEDCVTGCCVFVSVQLLRCSQIAAVKCQEITEAIKTALSGAAQTQ